jgi:asparagine synthetase B (glutamine-hydrolysing)
LVFNISDNKIQFTNHKSFEPTHSQREKTCKEITPECSASLSYSGGIDSNVIMNSIANLDLVAINITGKDAVADSIDQFLTPAEAQRLTTIDVGTEQWARDYHDLLAATNMPAQSWSFVGKWLVAKHCKSRVLFTGLGADELFGGYGIYSKLEYTNLRSPSPYSYVDHDGLWTQCLDAYNGDTQQATLLMDYWYQVVGVDAPGQDRISGAWGIETRNPFMSRRMMELALNLPWEFKVNAISKPLVRRAFLQRWPAELMLPKMGFAGHANDSLPWLNVTIDPTGDRHQDWKQIAQRTYYDNQQTH